jgi:hypothetical protein
MTNELLERADRAIDESKMLRAQRFEAMWKAEKVNQALHWIHRHYWHRVDADQRRTYRSNS